MSYLDTIKGRGSTVKFMVMTDLTKDAQGNYKRPANFNASALSLPETTTTDIPFTVAARSNDAAPVMYGSPAVGTAATWTDPEPGDASWTATITGNVQPTEAGRASMEALETAGSNSQIIWLEIMPNGETKARGGAAFINGGQFPVPADAVETFTFNITGKGKRWQDTSAATVAA